MEKHPSKQPEHISSFVAENNGIDVLPSTSSPSSDDDDVSFFDNLPPGYVFIPTDEEIIGYLRKKVNNESMPRNRIRDVELYKWDPWDLTEKHKLHRSDKGWYYLTPRERKYKNGDRPARATKSGYYKATGKATDIYVAGEKVGSKRSLVFHVGKSPNGDKSDWVMQEYKLKYPEGTKGRERQGKDDMLLDEWVLCKLHKKLHSDKKRGRSQEESCPNQEDIHPKKTKGAKKRKIKRKSEEVPVQPAEESLSRNQVESCHLMDEILSLTDQQEAHHQTNTHNVPIMNHFSQPTELLFPSDQQLVQPNPSHFDSSTNNLIAVSGLWSNKVHATPINQYQASLITSQRSNGGPKTESYPSQPVQPNPSNVSSSTGSLWGHSGIVSNISTPTIRHQSSVSLNHLSNCGPQIESYPSKFVQPNPSHLLASTCSHRGILSNRLHANPINQYGEPQTESYPYNASSSISPIQEPIQHSPSHFPFTGLSSNISHANPIGPFPSSSAANHLSSSNFSPMDNNGASSLGGRLDLPLPQLAQHIQMVMSQQRTTTLPPPKGTFNHDHQHRIAGNLPMPFDRSYLGAIFNPAPRPLASLSPVPSKLVPPPKCEPYIIN